MALGLLFHHSTARTDEDLLLTQAFKSQDEIRLSASSDATYHDDDREGQG